MLTPVEADAAIAATLAVAATERVPLTACAGRVLREPVHAERDAPPFDRVTMDGIAIASAALARREFRIAGIQPAGVPALMLPSLADCFEVMTGAMLPSGCDTIVPVERLRVGEGPGDDRLGPHAGAGPVRASTGRSMRKPATGCSRPACALARRRSRSRHRPASPRSKSPACPASRSYRPATNWSNPAGPSPHIRCGARTPTASRPRSGSRDSSQRPTGTLQMNRRCSKLNWSARSTSTTCWCFPAAFPPGASTMFRPHSWHWACEGFSITCRSVRGARCGSASARPPRSSSRCPATRCRCSSAWRGTSSRRSSCNLAPSARRVRSSGWRRNTLRGHRSPVSCRSRSGTIGKERHLAEPRPTGGSGDFISLAGTDGFVELPQGPATHLAGLAVPFQHW